MIIIFQIWKLLSKAYFDYIKLAKSKTDKLFNSTNKGNNSDLNLYRGTFLNLL